jgi:hypothetical protein
LNEEREGVFIEGFSWLRGQEIKRNRRDFAGIFLVWNELVFLSNSRREDDDDPWVWLSATGKKRKTGEMAVGWLAA